MGTQAKSMGCDAVTNEIKRIQKKIGKKWNLPQHTRDRQILLSQLRREEENFDAAIEEGAASVKPDKSSVESPQQCQWMGCTREAGKKYCKGHATMVTSLHTRIHQQKHYIKQRGYSKEEADRMAGDPENPVITAMQVWQGEPREDLVNLSAKKLTDKLEEEKAEQAKQQTQKVKADESSRMEPPQEKVEEPSEQPTETMDVDHTLVKLITHLSGTETGDKLNCTDITRIREGLCEQSETTQEPQVEVQGG